MLAPAGAAASACSSAAQAAAASEVVGTATNATSAASGGAVSCSSAPARRRAQAAPANCSSTGGAALVAVTYTVPVIVPPSGNADAAFGAINALTAADFAALAAVLGAGSNCPAASFSFKRSVTTAACGSVAVGGATCALPGSGATAAEYNAGAIIGGVLGGAAALAIFVALVLAASGRCACCGPCCPQAPPPPLGFEAALTMKPSSV